MEVIWRMSKLKDAYAIIGIITSISSTGRNPVIVTIPDAQKFMEMKKLSDKMITLTENKKHLDEQYLLSKITSLKHDILDLGFKISYNYGFMLDFKFDSGTGKTIMFLNQDGYTFDISEVLSI